MQDRMPSCLRSLRIACSLTVSVPTSLHCNVLLLIDKGRTTYGEELQLWCRGFGGKATVLVAPTLTLTLTAA